jgi:ribonuclease HII
MSSNDEIVKSLLFAGAGLLIGSVIASAAAPSEEQFEKKQEKAEDSKIKRNRSKISLVEMAKDNPNSNLGKKIRSKANLLDMTDASTKMSKRTSEQYKRLTRRQSK